MCKLIVKLVSAAGSTITQTACVLQDGLERMEASARNAVLTSIKQGLGLVFAYPVYKTRSL